MYTGKDMPLWLRCLMATDYAAPNMPLWQEASKYSSTTNIVMTLIENLLGLGYCITLDNFYTSPELTETLLSNRTDVYGYLRSHRLGIPQEIKARNLKKDEIIGFQKGRIYILKYMDKANLHAQHNTIHTINFVEQCKKKKKRAKHIQRLKNKNQSHELVQHFPPVKPSASAASSSVPSASASSSTVKIYRHKRLGIYVSKDNVLDAENLWALKSIQSHFSYNSSEGTRNYLKKCSQTAV
ncbi:hypothetical protein AVEN_86923-1 [Araneus ventricosus]|uniref:PiggyBac transposable element-derived protein domain-containing protein n=1 Tax=Araneus ventricosus TaxID=182803 RepID=A0A4Y2QUU6_ARAVE|nr:hypothetical protein AVEN_86923-1 [Araneus ventricosus]